MFTDLWFILQRGEKKLKIIRVYHNWYGLKNEYSLSLQEEKVFIFNTFYILFERRNKL